jgi:predicted ABC-type ATPase
VSLSLPDRAGKTTAAPFVLRDTLGINEFVNADQIASGLSGFNPEGAAFGAGRVMLKRLHDLAAQRESFAFETTLASRSFAPFVRKLKRDRYKFHLIFLWLATPDLVKARVAQRVAAGGHDISDEIIERRYRRGIENFFHVYQALADEWRLYDNSRSFSPTLIASGKRRKVIRVEDIDIWKSIRQNYYAIKKNR